jgi:hypothetical protein
MSYRFTVINTYWALMKESESESEFSKSRSRNWNRSRKFCVPTPQPWFTTQNAVSLKQSDRMKPVTYKHKPQSITFVVFSTHA